MSYFDSQSWELYFYVPSKGPQLKKKAVFHKSLPSSAGKVLSELPAVNCDNFETAISTHYPLFFSPFRRNRLSKFRYTMKYHYELPSAPGIYETTDSLAFLIFCLQNYAFYTADSSAISYTPSTIADSMKSTFKAFQKCAGIFEYILEMIPFLDETCLGKNPPFELSKEYNEIMHGLFVAQSQEVALGMSLDKEKKYAMFSKLSRKCHELYKKCYNTLSESRYFKKGDKNISQSILLLRGYLINKMILYDSFSLIQNALNFNLEGEHGPALYLLNIVVELNKKLKKTLPKFTERYHVKEAVKRAKQAVDKIDSVTSRLNKQFDMENKTIFHAKIPDSAPELLESQQIGTITKWSITVPWNLEGMKTMYYDTHTGAEEVLMREDDPEEDVNDPLSGDKLKAPPPPNPEEAKKGGNCIIS